MIELVSSFVILTGCLITACEVKKSTPKVVIVNQVVEKEVPVYPHKIKCGQEYWRDDAKIFVTVIGVSNNQVVYEYSDSNTRGQMNIRFFKSLYPVQKV